MEVTHQNGSPRRGEQCTGEDNPILNYRRALLKGSAPLSFQTTPNESIKVNFMEDALSNSVEFPSYSDMFSKTKLKKISHLLNMEAPHKKQILGSQTPYDESIKFKSVEDALSNFLVLRQIFTFLDDEDLESCCHVCQDWRTVADPLVVPHFGIKLAMTGYSKGRIVGSHVSAQLANCKHNITVGEGARYNRKSFTLRTDLGVTQILELILTQKVFISLRLSYGVDIQDDKVMDFLSNIGPHVVDLDLSEIYYLHMNVADFCKLLLQKFSNLKKLNCWGFRSFEDSLEDHLFDPDLPQNKHKMLRKIVFGNRSFTYLFVETMLKICPNLEKIEDFPLESINAIVVARKGSALKSLPYIRHAGCHETGETVVTAFEKLAGLEPKLTSLVFVYKSDRFIDTENSENVFEVVKPFLFRLLKSSDESLESLQIGPLRSDEVQYLPTLKGLKELELLQCPHGAGVFFTPEMPVKEILPNVCKLGFSDKLLWCDPFKWDEKFIIRHLPENIISPWGTQIIELSVIDPAVGAMPLLQRRFPSIQKLELKNSLVDLSKILLELPRFWPHLKSLTISCDKIGYEQMDLMDKNCRMRFLDHALTGIPFKAIKQLEDPYFKNFTDKTIRGFKHESIISKLKELRELKIFLHVYLYEGNAYMRLTHVANEFGFSLLPELAVTLVVEDHQFFAEAMKRDLEPLASCSNIEIVNRDGYPYVF